MDGGQFFGDDSMRVERIDKGIYKLYFDEDEVVFLKREALANKLTEAIMFLFLQSVL